MMLRKGMFIGDRYEILEQVGSGGMSEVYKAKCHKLNRYVAVKVLKQEFSEDKNFVAKFRVEAQSAAGLSHPNIVSVYDVGEENGLYYIVMELVEGITLKKYIQKKGRLSVKEATSIAIQVAQGIECAHNNHIIHRDIKPQNIIISKEGKVKVTDFGIARAASANTINSNAMGSVHYISPEQARGGYIDEKSDIYSLGITMFEMITGHLPFEGDSTVAIALQHIQGEMPDMRDYVDDLPISTEKIVRKCTQKKPDHRYLKISSLIADLKKSLITPDEDFVQIVSPVPVNGETVMYDPGEIKAGVTDINEKKTKIPVINEPKEAEEEDIDQINPGAERFLRLGGITVCLICVMIVGMLIFKYFGGTSIKNDEKETSATLAENYVYMPDLYGKTVEEIENTLRDLNLGRKFEYAKDNNAKEGTCFKQSVEANTPVAKYTQITLSISEGANRFEVTNYAGKTLKEAISDMERLELKYKIEYEYSDSTEINEVLSSSPLPPEEIQAGDTITLKVSRGKEYIMDGVVPSLSGLNLSAAKSKLESAGLGLGETKYVENEEIAKDQVISQEVKAGDKLPMTSLVNLVVSSGPPQVVVPDLGNGVNSKKKAQAILEAANLKLGTITMEYSDQKKGTVIGQSVQAGDKADKNSAINIVISKGKEPETTTEQTETTGQDESSSRSYSGSFSVSKSSNLGGATSGTFSVTVDGENVDVGEYADVSKWPSDTFVYKINKSTASICNVAAYLDGVQIYSMPVQVNQ